jgi:lipocalin
MARFSAGQFSLLLALLLAAPAAAAPVPPVPTNLTAYAGHWFQMYTDTYVASSFEKDAFCVTADYRLNADGTVSLFNSQANGGVDGPLDNVTGTAYATDTPGVLSVRNSAHFQVDLYTNHACNNFRKHELVVVCCRRRDDGR